MLRKSIFAFSGLIVSAFALGLGFFLGTLSWVNVKDGALALSGKKEVTEDVVIVEAVGGF